MTKPGMTKPATTKHGSPFRLPLPTVLVALACALLGGVGGWMWQAHRLRSDPAATLAPAQRAAMEQVVHDYLMAHPEVLPKAMEALEQRHTADRLGAVRAEVERPHPGAVLGNPAGKVTLVEFTDYACGYCRGSVADVDALIAANPDLKVVVRELPIIAPTSAEAARWALAAAEQGKYPAFHQALFAAGRTDTASIAAAAAAAGLDLARARRVSADPQVTAELQANLDLARELGINGTPSWVVGDQVLAGAVGQATLGQAIAAARGR